MGPLPDIQTVERRPAGAASGADGLETIVPQIGSRRQHDTAPFALVLAGVARRRVYFGIPAAEKAVVRAQARGEQGAHLELVRLQVVATIGGDSDA